MSSSWAVCDAESNLLVGPADRVASVFAAGVNRSHATAATSMWPKLFQACAGETEIEEQPAITNKEYLIENSHF
jgi:hypothetical protein